jgi:hypothetical protein
VGAKKKSQQRRIFISNSNLMAGFDSKIDDYIARAQPFAQEVLEHLRILVHKVCPDIQETVKWGFPHFGYKGIVCSIGAFKNIAPSDFGKARS